MEFAHCACVVSASGISALSPVILDLTYAVGFVAHKARVDTSASPTISDDAWQVLNICK